MEPFGFNAMERFKNKRIFITGISEGIGRACAEQFAHEGADVVGVYLRSSEERPAPTKHHRENGSVTMLPADIGNFEQLDAIWTDLTVSTGFDALILNAAFQKKATFDQTDLSLLEKTFHTNLFANFHLAKLYFAERGKSGAPGNIIVHTTNQAELVHPTGFAYALSKAALNHLVRHLAVAGAKHSIRVNAIVLGWFDTEGERRFCNGDEIKEKAKQDILLGRAGDPREAASMAAFMASDAAEYMTGAFVRLDGGVSLKPALST